MLLRRILFSCWTTASRRRNLRNIILMALLTICVLGYELKSSVRLRLPNITITLTGPILPFNSGNTTPITTTTKPIPIFADMRPTDTLPDVEFLLNARKLNIFAVRGMNEIVKSSEIYSSQCINWWSNPVTLNSITNVSQTEEYWDRNVSFVVHPGHFNCDVRIRQRKPPLLDHTKEDLEIISSFKCTPSLPNQYCLGQEASEAIKSVCQCGNSYYDDLSVLESETLKERIKWNVTDPELITWRLHKSFSVGDYLNFTNYDSYIHSPGRLNETFRANYCLPSTKLLIMVSSAPSHFLMRKVIRNTYGNPENLHGKGVRLVFMMGKLNGMGFQNDLEKEIATYNDIIVESFLDSYHNLTLSHLSMYKWIYLTCSQMDLEMPSHVLKADDDFLINVDLALRVIEENPQTEYMGCLYCGTKPIRDVSYMTKYYTPRYMYRPNMYVGYLSGVAYIFKTDIIPKVLHVSLTTPIIHMDDAYMTGLVPRQLQIYPRNSPLITYARINPDPCLLKKTVSSCAMDVEDMLLQWRKLKEEAPANCSLDYIDFHLQDLDERQKQDCYFK